MSLVWDHFNRGGSEKLCMLALADWCNDKGESLHPSIDAIAQRICVHRRNVQRILHAFIGEGLLEVVGNVQGGAPGQTRQYRLRLDLIAAMKPATGGKDVTPTGGISTTRKEQPTGDASATPKSRSTDGAYATPTGGTTVTPTGGADVTPQTPRRVALASQTGGAGATQSVIEPSKEKEEEPPIAPQGRFDDFWNAYPNLGRKSGKGEARKVWIRMKLDRLADEIVEHVTAMGRTEQWQTGYQPLPATYLGQERWSDPVPAAVAPRLAAVRPTAAERNAAFVSRLTGRARPIEARTVDVETQPIPVPRIPNAR